jgi:hypothetical protein
VNVPTVGTFFTMSSGSSREGEGMREGRGGMGGGRRQERSNGKRTGGGRGMKGG